MQYSVHNKKTNERETFYSARDAKKWYKAQIKSGANPDDLAGDKTKVWSNGDWEPCGPIAFTGNNAVFIANTRQTKPGY